jgi:tetratricopeptide (TPR) repeat protein
MGPGENIMALVPVDSGQRRIYFLTQKEAAGFKWSFKKRQWVDPIIINFQGASEPRRRLEKYIGGEMNEDKNNDNENNSQNIIRDNADAPDEDKGQAGTAVEHYNRGLRLAQEGELDLAIKEFTTARKLRPGMLETRVNIAGLLLQKGDYDGCIEESLKALEFRPDLDEACVNIGVAFMHKGMMENAIESLEKALVINPDSVASHINLGNAHLALGEIEKSIEHNTKAVGISPDFGMAHNNLAAALYQKGDIEKAKEHALRARDLGYDLHPEFVKALGI